MKTALVLLLCFSLLVGESHPCLCGLKAPGAELNDQNASQHHDGSLAHGGSKDQGGQCGGPRADRSTGPASCSQDDYSCCQVIFAEWNKGESAHFVLDEGASSFDFSLFRTQEVLKTVFHPPRSFV